MIAITAGSPDTATFERLAHQAIRHLPQVFRRHLTDVVVRVAEFADAEQLRSVGLHDPWTLSGLYHGHPVSEHSIWTSGELPPMIWLFRRPLLREWRETGVSLDDLITHVVIHEVGHHFGFTDAQMHAIENEAD
ncbi:MAG: metallopeptidase family protein [Novosphingobium sp.]|nr:metallopeptidase family protein [Novosphingobium sp.]